MLTILMAAMLAQSSDPRTHEEFQPIRPTLIAELSQTVCRSVQRYTSREAKLRQFEVSTKQFGLTPEEDRMLRMICSNYPKA